MTNFIKMIQLMIICLSTAYAGTKTEVILQNEISRLIEGRLDKRLYLVFVTINKDQKKKTESAQKMPLMPFAVDQELLNQKLKNALNFDDIDIEELQFTINITFDESISESTIDALRKSIQKRFSIDDVARKIEVNKSKIYAASNYVKEEINDRSDKLTVEIGKLESEKSKALIESERSRLELSRKEFEFQRKQASLEDQIKKESEQSRLELTKKELEIQKNQAKLEEQLRKETDKKGPISLAKEFQLVTSALFALIAIVIGLRIWGSAVKSGMGLMAEGIRAGAQGIGEALSSQNNQAPEEKPQANESNKPQTEEISTQKPESNWGDGNSDFEAYMAHMQEKIEVLGRQNNFAFVRQFTDMIEDDKTLPLAASLLVAVPDELARLIVKDVGSEHLRRIHKFLESPGGLASAKSLHKKALQEFYGRIAMDEFTNSPLMTLKNITWLTRMTSEQMSDFVFRLPQKYRSSFIACLSPHRTKSMLQSAKRREVRESIVRSIAGIGEVTMENINEFIEYAKSSPEVTQRTNQKSGLVDDMHYITAVMSELEPEDEEILTTAISNNVNLQAKIYQFYLPFKFIVRVSKEWTAQIFESRQKTQIALILFDAEARVREHVIGSLTGIKAEAVKEELKNLDEDKVYLLKNKKQSRKLQREVSNYILELVNNGTIELSPEGPAESQKRSLTKSSVA